MRGYYANMRNQSRPSDPERLFSPSFIYNQITSPDPKCDGGSTMKEALELMKRDGVATLAQFPYNPNDCSRQPSPQVRAEAQKNRIAGFTLLGRKGSIDLDDVKGALGRGNPVAVGLDIDGKAFSALRGKEVYRLDRPVRRGGHAVVIVGFDEKTQTFKLINSWGTRWGDNGFGLISYDSFQSSVDYAYTMDDGGGPLPKVTNFGPRPPPAPPPPTGNVLAAVASALGEVTKDFDCSRLALLSSSPTAGKIIGWVANQDQLDGIDAFVKLVGEKVHDVRLTAAVELRPFPQCEAMGTLIDAIKAPRGASVVALNHPGAAYQAGDRLELQVKTPDFASYLYVTYVQADGTAVPLYKPRGTVPQALPPGTTVSLGTGDDPRVFRIGPPFGSEMVVAVAAASPLFTDGIPSASTERAYLTALRKTLLYKPDPRQPDRVVDGSTLALTTREKTP